MNHYKYLLNWNGNNGVTSDSDNQFLSKYSDIHVQIKNSIYRADYFLQDLGHLLFIAKVKSNCLELCVAIEPDTKSENECTIRIKNSFSDFIIADRKKITEAEFINELSTSDELFGGEITVELYYLSCYKCCYPLC